MTEHTPVLYTATAVNRTGPDGESLTDSGWRVTVQSPGSPPAAPTAAAGTAGADAPAATPGRSEHATNPEELLALAWATCLSGSARIVAPGRDVTVRVEVALHEDPNGSGFAFTPTAFVSFSGADADQSQQLAASAHARCPVSKLLSGRGTATVIAEPHVPS